MAGGRAGSPEPAAGVPEGPRRPRTAGGPFRKTGRWRMGGSGCGAPGENRGFLPLQMKRRPPEGRLDASYSISGNDEYPEG